MIDQHLGEILMFAGGVPPRGWALCNGQLLPINQNQALFSLLGTMYGGNGQTTFALPDLRGRRPAHVGGNVTIQGARLGTEFDTITAQTMPAHVHDVTGLSIRTSSIAATSRSPVGAVPAVEASGVTAVYSSSPNAAMSAQSISGFSPELGSVGGGQPHENRPPFLAITFIIALQGIFPSRN
jgi:microcystin-dependent protein